MKTMIALLIMMTTAMAQSVPTVQNNATVNITGNYQNVTITQSGNPGHSVSITSTGDNVPISVTQSGTTPKSFSIIINCVSSCASSPYIINQY
jgi:hypothetical protein